MTNHFAIVGDVLGVEVDKVTKLTVEVPDRRKDKATGEWNTYGMPVRVTCFGESASVASRLAPGTHVAVAGRVQGRDWEGKTFVELVASDVVAVTEADAPANNDRLDDIPF